MSAVEYKQNAANCINAAATTTDFPIRASMLAMASSWLHLAEQAEKNSTADLVYETPPTRRSTQMLQQRQQQQQRQQTMTKITATDAPAVSRQAE
jgi:hypothetical protein